MLALICLVSAVYLILMALVMHTKNMASAIIFKVIPFFIGIGCLYVAGILSHILKF